jgi:hypothetical protein
MLVTMLDGIAAGPVWGGLRRKTNEIFAAVRKALAGVSDDR